MVGHIRNRLAALALACLAGGARAAYNPSERVLIEEEVASNSASLEFTKEINATYKVYVFEYWGLKPASDNQALRLRVSTDGGGTWKSGTTDYQFAARLNCSSGGFGSYESGADETYIALTEPTFGNGTGAFEDATGTVVIYRPSDSGRRTRVQFHSISRDYTADDCFIEGAGTYLADTAVDGFQFTYASGNIAAGTVRLYGVR